MTACVRGKRPKQTRPTSECEVIALSRISGSLGFLSFPRWIDPAIRRSGKGEETRGEKLLRLIQDPPPVTPSLAKISPTCQTDSPQTRIADSTRERLNFSSARITNAFRFAMRVCNPIVRPLESIAETQPQLQPALEIVDHLRGRFAHFKLCAHFLDLRRLLFYRCG